MIGDQESQLPVEQASGQDAELLLYDFFKYLVSLSLLTLGGVLTVSQIADPEDVKRGMLLAVLVTVAASGISAFSGASELVRARYTGTPPRAGLNFHRIVAPALLALGVGMFLAMFIDTLD